ncbi:ATPase domain-containing protein [Rhodovibrio salinarum]|nr:ATPase domain-containing protein [Rhodovibrio salinarum]
MGKRPTGIVGFDQLSRGGLPANAATLLLGGPGAGKTVFALQTVVNAAHQSGTRAVFVAFEETPEEVRSNAAAFDWAQNGELEKLHFIDARGPLAASATGRFDLSGLLAQLGELARREDIGWIVLDGLDNVLDLLPDEVSHRREIFRLSDFLSEIRVPALVTGKLNGEEAALSSYDAMQFAARMVVKLSGGLNNGVFGRSLRIVKYRGSDHDNIEAPFVIDAGGIAVAYHGANVPQHKLSSDRLPTGVSGLDQVLGGGYQRGYAVLLSGAPGTAKTTLGACFLSAGVDAGERGLLVALDETYEQIATNAAGIGLHLQEQIADGRVMALSMRSAPLVPEAFFLRIERAIREHSPTIVVIDPISAVMERRLQRAPFDAAARLVDLCKSRGITLMTTTLASGVDDPEARSRISTLADAWIALSYQVQTGARKRALSVVKARGILHSNQVSELVIGANGVHLAEIHPDEGAARITRSPQDDSNEAERRRRGDGET